MWKAASVPQQLTPLLQAAACHVDGISPPLLPVTQSRRGCRQMLHLCVCFTVLPVVESYRKQKSCWEHRKPSSAQASIFIVSGWLQRVSAPWIKIKVMSSSMSCFCCTHSWSWFDFFLNFKSFFNLKLSCFELCLGLPQALLWNRSCISRPTPTRCSATSYKFWRCPCSPWSCPSTAGFPTFPNDTYLACESRQLTL